MQEKVQQVAEYSLRQGEKLDRMTTALELYVGKKLGPEATPADIPALPAGSAARDQRIDRVIKPV